MDPFRAPLTQCMNANKEAAVTVVTMEGGSPLADCGFIGIFSTDASGHANTSFIGRFGDPSSVINVNAGNFGTVLATAGALLGCAR
jgi:hypothetical protein